MALLQIFLPEGWPDSDPADGMPMRWRLADGATVRVGESALSQMPRGAEVELIAPAGRVLLTRVKLPPGSTQKLAEVVGYAVEDRLLGDPESIQAAVGGRDAEGNATAAIVDRAWLASVRDKFAASGRRANRLVSEIAAVPVTAGAWDLVWHGSHGWLRTGEDQGSVLDAAGDGAPLALALAVQEARAAEAAPNRIVIHPADGRDLPELARWQQELDLPVEAGSPWSWQRIPVPLTRGINLLQGAFAPSRSGAELLSRYRLPVLLAAGIAGLYILVSVGEWAWLAWQKSRAQAQMVQTFKATFPDSNVPEHLVQVQMGRRLADLKRAHGEAQPGDFLPLLANALPVVNITGGTAQGVQYERGKIQVDVRLPQVQSAEALNQRLSGLPARVESVTPSANGALARITFTAATS